MDFSLKYHTKKISSCLRELFFPYACALCHSVSDQAYDLCVDCEASLYTRQILCHYCGKTVSRYDTENPVCGSCLSKPNLIDRFLTIGIYHDDLKKLILDLKFHHRLYIADILGKLLVKQINSSLITLPDAILPVPLHAKRIVQRGFNQSIEIAKPISKALKIPLLRHAIKRVKNTQPQTDLHEKQRIKNIKNAFQINDISNYKHIALLDDVVTTGSTINELVRLLKKTGVETVQVWCVARA